MHKFTIFTIILSVVVILIVADLVLNDYWGDDFAKEEHLEEEVEVGDPELRGDESISPEDEPSADETEENVEIIEEELTSAITEDLVLQMGLVASNFVSEPYDGLIYGFWDVEDDFKNYTVSRHKLFDGNDYVGAIYEIQTSNEVAQFDAYEVLRVLASASSSGEINENNTYGDASFYFNHTTKTNTVYLTFQKGKQVYAFEYAGSYHANIKALIDLL